MKIQVRIRGTDSTGFLVDVNIIEDPEQDRQYSAPDWVLTRVRPFKTYDEARHETEQIIKKAIPDASAIGWVSDMGFFPAKKPKNAE